MLNPWQKFGAATVVAIVFFACDAFLWDGSLLPFALFITGSGALAYGCIRALRSPTPLPLVHKLLNYAGIVVGLTLALVFILLTGATLLASPSNS